MTTRVEHMKALKDTWRRAPTGPKKDSAYRDYLVAQKENLARSKKEAAEYLNKAVDALK